MNVRVRSSRPERRIVHREAAYSLIEIIGVISIIAILLTLLVPRIYGVINDARIAQTAMSYRSMVAGATGHYSKWQAFRKVDGATYAAGDYPVEDYDWVLFDGGYLEEPFILPIGNGLVGDDGEEGMDAATDGTRLRLLNISGLKAGDEVTAGDDDVSGTYRLQPTGFTPAGRTASANETAGVDAIGSYLVEAVIPGVFIEDARELNARIDGNNPALAAQDWGDGAGNYTTADYTGKVKWKQGEGGTVTVFLYIAHR
ncbi:MAG: hypothetical protein H7A46_14060 [Verrucomicrobiales bacterium]|nr:hypothetical protein [Verrucomicrobiales bacterium]